MTTESKDLERLIAAAINAHRNLHQVYGSTAACGGGIGGAMITQHCGVVCGNHQSEVDAWSSVEEAYFARRDGDPDWARFLPEG